MLAQRAARHPKITYALIVLLLVTLISGIIGGWQALLKAEEHQSKARLQIETNAIANQLQIRFELQAQALQRLGLRWASHYDDPATWQLDVLSLLDGFDNFQAIEWLDRGQRRSNRLRLYLCPSELQPA